MMERGSQKLILGVVKSYPAPDLREIIALSKLTYNCENTTKQRALTSVRLLIRGFGEGPIQMTSSVG